MLRGDKMNKIMNGGATICGDHKSVVIKNGQVYIDGELVSDQRYNYSGPIIINGNVEEVDGVNITINGDVHGDVDGTTIQIKGSVLGDVDGTTVNIGNNKPEKKSSDVADSLYNKPKKYNNFFDLDEYNDLERKLNQSIELIKNKLAVTEPELEETFRKADNIAEDSKKEQESEQLDLKDLVKRNKKKKKR